MGVFSKNEKMADDSPGEHYGEDTAVGYIGDENAIHKSEFTEGNSLYARLQRMAGRFGVEQRGIERVPSDERTDTGMSKIGTLVCLFFLLLALSSHGIRRSRLLPTAHLTATGCVSIWRLGPLPPFLPA
jgi:hypothetical protein